jgi:ring-1,2-phenylacetyl-CoA epoxidase subunit PaaE
MSTEFYPLTISKVERLTKESVAIDFTVAEELKEKFQYKQGQHLTLKADINGQDIRRSYSICKGVGSQALTVGVKAIEGGVFSNFANSELKKGMTLEVMSPQGHFYSKLSIGSSKQYLLVAVGSGITPILSQIDTILTSEPNS